MRHFWSGAAVVAAILMGAVSARANVPMYSFENGDSPNNLDGFANNGGGITVTQSTIGVTAGANSMENSTVAGATFTGALTSSVPAIMNSPTVSAISFDLTTQAMYSGAFADVGITIFGEVGGNFGFQYQVDNSQVQNAALAPGTYHETIGLIGTDPTNFAASQPYSEVLGNGFVPTGVEFFYSKSNDAPLDVFIDNVQAVVPEPASISIGAFGGLLLMARRRRAASK